MNAVLALQLLLPVALILLPIYVLYLATIRDHGGFLYRGRRLGRGKREFIIYKVRSLKVGAEARIRFGLHQAGSPEELWYGNFIRRTRLDELPQVFNVLRGDMDFVGPRPERREVYEAKLRFMPEYDMRFLVKPGLTGLSQLVTPHSTPKRIRAVIDNRYFVRRNNVLLKYLVFLSTIRVFAWKILCESVQNFLAPVRNLVAGKTRKNRRARKRIYPRDLYCSVNILLDIDPHLQKIIADILTNEFRVKNISQTAVLVEGKKESVGALVHCLQLKEQASRQESGSLDLKFQMNRWKGVKSKIANCSGRILALRAAQWSGNRQILLAYSAKSDIDKYLIDKYLLKESFS